MKLKNYLLCRISIFFVIYISVRLTYTGMHFLYMYLGYESLEKLLQNKITMQQKTYNLEKLRQNINTTKQMTAIDFVNLNK